jgi:hypothetical protein
LATSWQAQDNTDRAVGQVNLADSTANEWQITGVQLEVGEVATPFEHRSYGDELARCQRYYWDPTFGKTSAQSVYLGIGCQYSSTTVFLEQFPPVAMRTEPSLNVSNSAGHFTNHSNGGNTSFSTLSIDGLNSTTCLMTSGAVSRTAGHATFVEATDSATFAYNAEL